MANRSKYMTQKNANNNKNLASKNAYDFNNRQNIITKKVNQPIIYFDQKTEKLKSFDTRSIKSYSLNYN